MMIRICAVMMMLVLFLSMGNQGRNSIQPPKNPIQAPSDYFLRQRSYPNLSFDRAAHEMASDQVLRLKAKTGDSAPQWQSLGPTRVVAGRLTDIEIFPDGEIWVGTASGGIFSSTDSGTTWNPEFEDSFSSTIGDLAYAPSHPDRIYVGTGEANGGGGSSTYPGIGVYRSDDRGQTWLRTGLEDSRFIGRVVVHPTNPDWVYAAAMGELYGTNDQRGLFRTTDGGLTWEKVLYISEGTGCIDVAIDPHHPETLYACMWQRRRQSHQIDYAGPESGLYKSTDGGNTWKKLTQGLPSEGDVGRVGVAVSTSNPNRLFAIFTAPDGSLAGVFKSNDAGESWSRTADAAMAENYNTFGWWFGQIRVHPTNPDFVFASGLLLFFSTDGGDSWQSTQEFAQNSGLLEDNRDILHVDQHALAFHPNDPNFIAAGNDGGIYISKSEPINFKNANDIPNLQFYTCEIDPSVPAFVYGGTQDNGTWGMLGPATTDWVKFLGGDGFQVEVDPTNSNSIYLEYQYGNLFHYLNGRYIDGTGHLTDSDRANWNAPILIDPNRSNVVYHASQRLFRTNQGVRNFQPISEDLTKGDLGGNRVFATITTIGVAFGDSDRIYVGTDDGNFQVTSDGGDSWENRNAGLPNRWITGIAVHPGDKDTVYVSLSGFTALDYQPYLMRSRDAGNTWEDVSANLPASPINDVLVDPTNAQRLFVGNDFGVFFSRDEGLTWQILGRGLPNTLVSDIDLHMPSQTLVAATFGRGMFRLDLSSVLNEGTMPGSQLAHRYVLAELHGGLRGETQIGIVNSGETTAHLELFAFSESGDLLNASPVDLVLEGKQRFYADLEETFPEVEGVAAWVQVGSDLPVVAFAEIGDEQARSAYLAQKAEIGLAYLPHIARDTQQFETFVSSVNPHPTALTTHIFPANETQGQLIREHLLPHSQMGRDIRDYFGINLDAIPFARMEEPLRGAVSMEYFHRIPERRQMAALGLTGERGRILRFLHVAADTANFWTGMVYLNPGTTVAKATETFYAADGTRLGEFQRPEIGPGGKITLLYDASNPVNLPNGTAWVEVESDQELVGYDLFGSSTTSNNDFFAGIQGAYTASATLVFPHFLATDVSWLGLVAVNTSALPADLRLQAYSSSGEFLEESVLRDVPGKGKETHLVANLFPNPEVQRKAAWVLAIGAEPIWNGFLLWGDLNATGRLHMSGMVAPPAPQT